MPLCTCVLSHFSPVWLFASPWTAAHQVPLSMGFSRQGYWRGLPCPLQGIFLTQVLNSHFLCLLHWRWIFTTSTTWAAPICLYGFVFQTQLKLLKRGYVLPQRWWSSNPRRLQPRKFFGKILPKMYLLFQLRPKGNKEVNYCVSSLMLYNKLPQKMI